MIEHLISRIINLVILILVYKISVMAVAISGAAGVVILAVIIMVTSKVFTGYKFKDQIKDIIGLIFMSAIMFAIVFKLGIVLNLNPIIELLIQLIIGVTIYLSLSIAIKPEGYTFCLEFIKRIIKKRRC